jgi:hypothetical protein
MSKDQVNEINRIIQNNEINRLNSESISSHLKRYQRFPNQKADFDLPDWSKAPPSPRAESKSMQSRSLLLEELDLLCHNFQSSSSLPDLDLQFSFLDDDYYANDKHLGSESVQYPDPLASLTNETHPRYSVPSAGMNEQMDPNSDLVLQEKISSLVQLFHARPQIPNSRDFTGTY